MVWSKIRGIYMVYFDNFTPLPFTLNIHFLHNEKKRGERGEKKTIPRNMRLRAFKGVLGLFITNLFLTKTTAKKSTGRHTDS